MVPKFLVVTGNAPGYDGVGAILNRQILEILPREQVKVAYTYNRHKVGSNLSNNPWVDLPLARCYEPSFRPIRGITGEIVSASASRLVLGNYVNKLLSSIVRFGKKHQCEAVLAVLDCPTAILMAHRLANRLRLPLYCFVMDHPNLFVRDFNHDRFFKAYLLRCFDKAMDNASRIAVAGETMQVAFEQRYAKKGIILRQGLPYEDFTANEHPAYDALSDVIRIGFAGSLTAKDTFQSFLEGLVRRQWRLNRKPVILRLLGARLTLAPTGPQHIEYFGWRSIPELVSLMQECDILYLPQSFDLSLKDFSELSFPNKLCTYVPARRPVALQSPPNGSMVKFFQKYQCGPCSTQLNADELLDHIETALEKPTLYRRYQVALDNAFAQELNQKQLKINSAQFLASQPLHLE